MGIIARQSIKSSIVMYVGAIIGFFNVILITPYCLPPELVGLSRVLIETAFLMTLLGQLGITSGILKFSPEFQNQLNNLRFFSLVTPLLGFSLLVIIYFLYKSSIILYFASNSPLFNEYINFTIPLAFILLFTNIVETFSTIEKRIVVPSFIRNIILKVANIGIIFLFYFDILSVKSFIISIIVIYGIVLILNIFYLKKISRINFLPDFSVIDKSLFKRFFKYILFVFALGFGNAIASKIDVFMISSSLNLTQTGIYTIAFYITSIIDIPSRSLLSITYPFVAEQIHTKDNSSLNELYRKSSLIQLIIGGILFFLMWVNIDSIFAIMPNGEIYKSGKYVIFFLGINKIIDMTTGINSQIVSTSKLYPFMGVFFIYLAITTIWFNYLLIPIYGISGAALATLISVSSYNIILVIFLKLKMRLFPFDLNTLKVVVIFLIIFLINEMIPEFSNLYLDLILRSTVILFVFLSLIFHLKISEDVNMIVKSALGLKFLNKIKDQFKLK